MPAIVTTALTRTDIIRACRFAEAGEYTKAPCEFPERKVLSRDFIGKEIELHADGKKLKFKFDRGYMIVTENCGCEHEEAYELLKLAHRDVYLLHYMDTREEIFSAKTIVLEMDNGQVTIVDDTIGKMSATRDINRKIVFGTIGENGEKHQEENEELVCKTFDWKFGENAIIHMSFVNCECMALINPDNGSMPGWHDYYASFNPCRYVQLEEDLFLISFYAPWACGMEVSMLMDLDDMTAACASFGFDSTDKFVSNTFTARGALAPLGFIGRFAIE